MTRRRSDQPGDLDALLSLAQWLSPTFPVGGYTYSQGLEWAISRGEVHSAVTLQAWLGDLLEHGAGRSDAVLLCLALRAEMPLDELSDLAVALAPSRERLLEAEAQGAAFSIAQAALGAVVPPLVYPLAVGVAARRLSLPVMQVAALWLQAYAGNLMQIAVRLVPLGQGEGQAVVAALRPLLLRVAAEAAEAGPEALGSAAFHADLAAMAHETMEVRLCRT